MRKFLFKIIHNIVSRYPRLVVFLSFALAALAGFYGTANMEMITDQDQLLSEDLAYHHKYMEFIRKFGDLEFLYIIIEGETQEKMIGFADALASRLERSSDIDDIIYAFDTRWAADYALYFDEAPISDLQKFQSELDANRDDIKTLFTTASVDEALLKISTSLNQDNQQSAVFTEDDANGLQNLIDALSGKPNESFKDLQRLEKGLAEEKNSQKRYNWSGSGGFLLMLVMPSKDFSTLSVIEAPLKNIRANIWLTKQDFPGVKAGVTGRPALQADEMRTTNEDMLNASLLALAGVTIMFIIFFRELWRPLCAIFALLCAMGWTYGFVALTLGHLNLLSLVFALILIGLGVDFGIHFLHRYQEELKRSADPSIAVHNALHHVGSGILTGATTSSVAFMLAMMTDFLGLAELGYVAGVGILFCLLAMLVTLPALLIFYDSHIRWKDHLPTPVHLLGLRHVSRYPGIMLIVIIIITTVLAPKVWQVSFNDNLLDLQAEGLESVEYEHKLMDESEFSTWYCAFPKRDLQQARAISDKLKSDPTVAGVESIVDALPQAPPEKSALIHSLRDSLDQIVTDKEQKYTPNPFIYQALVQKVQMLDSQIQQVEEMRRMQQEMMEKAQQMKERAADPSQMSPEQRKAMQNDPQQAARMQQMGEGMQIPEGMEIPEGIQMPEGMQIPEGMDISQMQENGAGGMPEIPEIPPEQIELLNRLKKLTALLDDKEEIVTARLAVANRELLERPRKALRTLHKLTSADEPTTDVLPDLFQRLFVGKDGSLLVMAYPKEDIWETESMEKFVGAMRQIDPEVTGTPIQVYESSLLMRNAFSFIGICSLIVVSLLVLLDFLSMRALFYVIIPLLLGVLWLVEIMGLFAIQLNLANFFAIPILIGIGVDNAVHFFHRYEENHDAEKSMYTTGTTLTLTTLTTITGFGSLMFASHKGLASLGVLMALGSATCWFSCVVVMPTLIKLTCRHHKARMQERDA